MKTERERRKTARHLCADFVQLSWMDDTGGTVSSLGLLEDVSPEGLCVSVDEPVPVERGVRIHTKGFEGEAQVRYCELGDYGYLVGLEFAEGSSWEREKWRPKHLYEPVVDG